MNALRNICLALALASYACGSSPGDPCAVTESEYPCYSATVTYVNAFGDTVSCNKTKVPDGQPCRTGVGICEDGTCAMPDAGHTSCSPDVITLPDGAQNMCGTVDDCDHTNPCRVASCPSPFVDACKYEPVPDGLVDCAEGKQCFGGSCCVR